MFYEEILPSKNIASLVCSFWEFAVGETAEQSLIHEVFPDGCISLVFRRNKKTLNDFLLITEIHLRSKTYVVEPSDVFWGMRISPAVCRDFLGINPAEIQTVPVRFIKPQMRHFEKLQSDLSACQNLSEAIKVFEALFQDFKIQTDERLIKAVGIFIKSQGQAKICDVARKIGMSPRHFQRRFLYQSGLTPKQFARACRLRATAIDAAKKPKMNWAQHAAELGYTDQSHLAHEISSVTGQSPFKFAKNISRIHHGNLIE